MDIPENPNEYYRDSWEQALYQRERARAAARREPPVVVRERRLQIGGPGTMPGGPTVDAAISALDRALAGRHLTAEQRERLGGILSERPVR